MWLQALRQAGCVADVLPNQPAVWVVPYCCCRSNSQGNGAPGMKAGPFHAAGHSGGSQPKTADEKGRK